MFKVTDGQVQEVKPLLGHTFLGLDRSPQVIIDKVVKRAETLAQTHTGLNRGLNPNGY